MTSVLLVLKLFGTKIDCLGMKTYCVTTEIFIEECSHRPRNISQIFKVMKRILLLAMVASLLSFTTGKQETTDSLDQATPSFKPGENLTYVLYYGIITGGTASLSVNEIEVHGRKLYHARAKASTAGWADAMYKVRDVYESYFDITTGKPLLAVRDIKENNYKYYNEVVFKHHQNKVSSQKSGEHEVPENIFDIVSAFYHSREKLFNNIEVGDTIKLMTYFSDEIYPIEVRYRGKEKIKTKAGKFNAMKFSPIVEVGRIFDTEDDMTFWVSDDKNYIPLRVEFELMIGSLKCDLIEYDGISHDLSKID